MKVDLYALGLLKFRNGKIVLSERELRSINGAIGGSLRGLKLCEKEREEPGEWHVFSLKTEPGSMPSYVGKLTLAELGYYHHRAIMHFKLNVRGKSRKRDEFSVLRRIRRKYKKLSDEMMDFSVKGQINRLVDFGKLRKEGEVLFIYTYLLIVVERDKQEFGTLPFSEETTSLCFDIVEPYRIVFRKIHTMRISIPSTILYIQKGIPGMVFLYIQKQIPEPILYILKSIHEELCRKETQNRKFLGGKSIVRDMINAIYQHCLYEKKSEEERKTVFDNAIDENLLVKLWTHFLDTMGGRTVDVFTARVMVATSLLALLAVICSFITLVCLLLS